MLLKAHVVYRYEMNAKCDDITTASSRGVFAYPQC